MRLLNCTKIRIVLVGFVVAIAIGGGSAKADFTFGMPVNLGPTVNSFDYEFDPCISTDGLMLFFNSYRPGGYGESDLWVATRKTTDEPWSEALNIGPIVNSSAREEAPSISADGLSLYFSSDRPGSSGGEDLWVATRETMDDNWGEPVNLGTIVNSSASEHAPSISSDDLSLLFAERYQGPFRPGGSGGGDMWVTRRPNSGADWGTPTNLGPIVNSSSVDEAPSISANGLALFFMSGRTGVYGRNDIWISKRETVDAPWAEPVNLGPTVNSSANEINPDIATDGCTLYFSSDRPAGLGGHDIWQVTIIPIVDFNGDGIVDSADMCIIVDNWGTDNSLCDIGPMPWGDGIVDVQDLIVLAEHLFEEPGLVAYWELDETEGDIAYDSIGVYDGILSGVPTWQPTGGMIDGALQFDGTDDYVSTPFILNPAEGPFSVTAWIKGGAPGQAVLSQPGGANWLCVDSLEGCLMTELKATGRGAAALLSQAVITDGYWHRIGLVWDGSHRILYVDDVAVAEDAKTNLEGSENGLYLGCGMAMEPGSFFSGLIDDVRIYNRAVIP